MSKIWNNVKAVFHRLVDGKKNPFLMVTHPSETMEDLKHKKNGSTFYATLLLLALTISAIIKEVATGFIYSTLRIEDFNIVTVLCTSGVMVLLFVVGNWALCTLFSGEGSIKDIYIMTCYNLTPLIFFNIFGTIMSQMLVPGEYVFVSIIGTCCTLWFACLMIYGAMTIHNYTFWGTILNLVMSMVAMAVIFFLVFLFIVLMQQLYVFILTLFTEVRMRIYS